MEKKISARMLSSVQIAPALKYGEKKKMEGNRNIGSFFFRLNLYFKHNPLNMGIRRQMWRLINLNTSSYTNIFLKITM